VGITLNFTPAEPASPSRADFEATRHFDGYFQRWFLDPLYGRHYPADMVADYTEAGYLPADGLPFVRKGDLEAIAAPTDFLGVNYYTREVVRDGEAPDNLPQTTFPAPESERTEMGWEVYPNALYRLLNRLYFEYQPPKLYITENGASYGDAPDGDGRVLDSRRVEYLREHLAAAHRAIGNGVPLAGYFVWSFLDNFEWAKGNTQRFGIVWVDYESQQRLPKESALWYGEVARTNSVPATPQPAFPL
jgi:beta-glucosidase